HRMPRPACAWLSSPAHSARPGRSPPSAATTSGARWLPWPMPCRRPACLRNSSCRAPAKLTSMGSWFSRGLAFVSLTQALALAQKGNGMAEHFFRHGASLVIGPSATDQDLRALPVDPAVTDLGMAVPPNSLKSALTTAGLEALSRWTQLEA